MEPFKKQNFTIAHPDVPFPPCRTLDASEAGYIVNQFRSIVSLPDGADGLAIVIALAERETLYLGTDALGDAFELRAVCRAVQIQPASQTYLNWYRFDRIDQLGFDDLALYFDDIWYPGCDDIDIFDQTLSWVLSVSHYGQISTVKFEGKQRGKRRCQEPSA